MPTFQIAKSHSRIAKSTAKSLLRKDFIRESLAAMCSAGFDRARYYEVTRDLAARRDVVVLIHEEGSADNHEGFMVDLTASTLCDKRGRLSLEPAIGTAFGDQRDPEWVDELSLKGRHWVEIPVTAGPTPVGILACDWLIEREIALTVEALQALQAIGVLVGSYLGLKPIAVLDQYRTRRSDWAQSDPRQMVIDALPYLAELVDAAAAAVFAFSWPDQSLTKIEDYIAPSLQAKADELEELPERYGSGKYLTGRAWERLTGSGSEHSRVHHVVSFASLALFEEEDIEPKSKKWHENLLGDIRSLMYAIVGSVERRFLIRFINRADRPLLPFVREITLLDTIVSELRSDVDSAFAKQRSRALQTMADGASNSAGPSDLLDQIHEQLTAEAVEHMGIICRNQDSAQFGFVAFRGPKLDGARFDLAGGWSEDPFYAKAEDNGTRVLRLSDYPNTVDEGLVGVLRRHGFKGALTSSLESGQTRGVFLVPLDSVKLSRSEEAGLRLPSNYGYNTTPMLDAYGRLIGNMVELQQSQAKVDGARRALGLMGHELRAPLSALGSAAELAMDLSQETIEDFAPLELNEAKDLLKQIEQHRTELHKSQNRVDIALEFAPIVAKESEGGFELAFRFNSLPKLIRAAMAEVESELHLDEDRRAYLFNMTSSARKLEEVICDPDYLRHALKNVLRNAAKYSQQRRRDQPILVDVFGEPQAQWVGIKVRNWGYGIPESHRDLIFEAWVRGEKIKTYKARPHFRGVGAR